MAQPNIALAPPAAPVQAPVAAVVPVANPDGGRVRRLDRIEYHVREILPDPDLKWLAEKMPQYAFVHHPQAQWLGGSVLSVLRRMFLERIFREIGARPAYFIGANPIELRSIANALHHQGALHSCVPPKSPFWAAAYQRWQAAPNHVPCCNCMVGHCVHLAADVIVVDGLVWELSSAEWDFLARVAPMYTIDIHEPANTPVTVCPHFTIRRCQAHVQCYEFQEFNASWHRTIAVCSGAGAKALTDLRTLVLTPMLAVSKLELCRGTVVETPVVLAHAAAVPDELLARLRLVAIGRPRTTQLMNTLYRMVAGYCMERNLQYEPHVITAAVNAALVDGLHDEIAGLWWRKFVYGPAMTFYDWLRESSWLQLWKQFGVTVLCGYVTLRARRYIWEVCRYLLTPATYVFSLAAWRSPWYMRLWALVVAAWRWLFRRQPPLPDVELYPRPHDPVTLQDESLLQDVCHGFYTMSEPPLAQGADIVVPPGIHECRPKVGTQRLGPYVLDAPPPFCWRSCIHNEYNALRYRLLIETPAPEPGYWARLSLLPEAQLQPDPELKVTFEDWVSRASWSHSRKEQIRKAEHEDIGGDYYDKLYSNEMMIKRENNSPTKLYSAPRAIQMMSPHFQARTGLTCYYFSKLLAQQWHYDRVAGPHEHIITFASGMNYQQIGHWLEYCIDHLAPLADLCFFRLDCSKFDTHQGEEALAHQHGGMRRVALDDVDVKAVDSLEASVDCHGRSRHGIRYKRRGGRLTGGNDTTGGNSFNNGCVLADALRRSGARAFGVVGGDDAGVVTCRVNRDAVSKSLRDCYREAGLTLKLEVTDDLEQFIFFSGRFYPIACACTPTSPTYHLTGKRVSHVPVWYQGRYCHLIFGPLVGRQIAKIFYCVDLEHLTPREWARAVGMCLFKQCPHVPILGDLGRKVLSLTTGEKDRALRRSLFSRGLEDPSSNEVDISYDFMTTTFVCHAYGISPDTLEAMLSEIRTLPSLTSALRHPFFRRMIEMDYPMHFQSNNALDALSSSWSVWRAITADLHWVALSLQSWFPAAHLFSWQQWFDLCFTTPICEELAKHSFAGSFITAAIIALEVPRDAEIRRRAFRVFGHLATARMPVLHAIVWHALHNAWVLCGWHNIAFTFMDKIELATRAWINGESPTLLAALQRLVQAQPQVEANFHPFFTVDTAPSRAFNFSEQFGADLASFLDYIKRLSTEAPEFNFMSLVVPNVKPLSRATKRRLRAKAKAALTGTVVPAPRIKAPLVKGGVPRKPRLRIPRAPPKDLLTQAGAAAVHNAALAVEAMATPTNSEPQIWPDGEVPSTTLKLQFDVELETVEDSVSSDLFSAFFLVPRLKAHYLTPTAAAAGVITWTAGTDHPDLATIESNFALYRVTAMSATPIDTTAALTRSGLVYSGTIADMVPPASIQAMTRIPGIRTRSTNDEKYVDGKELIWRPLTFKGGGTNYSGTVSTPALGWKDPSEQDVFDTAVCFIADKVATGARIVVRVVMHINAVPFQSVARFYDTANPLGTEAAIEEVSSAVDVGMKDSEPSDAEAWAVQAIRTVRGVFRTGGAMWKLGKQVLRGVRTGAWMAAMLGKKAGTEEAFLRLRRIARLVGVTMPPKSALARAIIDTLDDSKEPVVTELEIATTIVAKRDASKILLALTSGPSSPRSDADLIVLPSVPRKR